MLPVIFSLSQQISCATLVCQKSLSKDASLVSQAAPPVVYQSPITITAGGTYSGNWESQDPNVPAVTINTSQAVVIKNSNLQGRGDLIDASNGGANLTVSNTKGYALNPNVAGQSPGHFLKSTLATNIVVENCYMESTTGIWIVDHGSATKSVRIRYNRVHNIDGRKSDGLGGFSANFFNAQFVALDHVQNVPGIELAWNEVINEPYKSRVEDNINIYKSGGTSASPMLIHDNYIQGAYGAQPTQTGYSGGGILLGDDSYSPNNGTNVGFVKAYNNQIVNSSNHGIGIAAGHDNEIYNNRIIYSGQLPDGTSTPGGLGIYIRDVYNNQSVGLFYNNFADNNTIGVVNGANGNRNDTWLPDCAQSKCTNNTSLPSPITLDTEKAEYQTWQNKVSSNNVAVGPQ